MNRTAAYLGLAAALVLTAVIVESQKGSAPQPPPPQVAQPPEPPPPAPLTVRPSSSSPGSLTLTGSLSHPRITPGTSNVFATFDVTAVQVPNAKRAPVNLALVIDRSGSMSGAKIANARRAASRLVDLLNADDRLAIIHYGNDVRTMPGTFATEENKARLKRFIAGIQEEGGTNIGAGLEAGQRQIEVARSDFRVNRVMLLSDGQPTVGITSGTGLARLVGTMRSAGVSVTSLGVGADFNEDLMQHLADVGGGSFGFISEGDGALMARVFERDLSQAGTLVARATTLTLTPPAGTTIQEVFGRPIERRGSAVVVSLPDFSAGQVERLVVRLSMEAQPGATAVDAGRFVLTYRDLLTERDADSAVALSALVTNDVQLAQQSRDKSAFVAATRAVASENLRKAANAIRDGDMREAQNELRKNDSLFDEAAAVAGPAAVADDRVQAQGYFGLASAPAESEPARREQAKQMKVQSLKGSGRGDSVY